MVAALPPPRSGSAAPSSWPAPLGYQAIVDADADVAIEQVKPSEDSLAERGDELATIAVDFANFLKQSEILVKSPMQVPIAAELVNSTMLAVLGDISARGGSFATQRDAVGCLGMKARPVPLRSYIALNAACTS